jgi:hypothetical protein
MLGIWSFVWVKYWLLFYRHDAFTVMLLTAYCQILPPPTSLSKYWLLFYRHDAFTVMLLTAYYQILPPPIPLSKYWLLFYRHDAFTVMLLTAYCQILPPPTSLSNSPNWEIFQIKFVCFSNAVSILYQAYCCQRASNSL